MLSGIRDSSSLTLRQEAVAEFRLLIFIVVESGKRHWIPMIRSGTALDSDPYTSKHAYVITPSPICTQVPKYLSNL